MLYNLNFDNNTILSSIHFALFLQGIISCFNYIFQSKFLAHIFKVIIYSQLNQEFLISQLIVLLYIFFHIQFLHSLQIIERANVFSKMHDISGISIFFIFATTNAI